MHRVMIPLYLLSCLKLDNDLSTSWRVFSTWLNVLNDLFIGVFFGVKYPGNDPLIIHLLDVSVFIYCKAYQYINCLLELTKYIYLGPSSVLLSP